MKPMDTQKHDEKTDIARVIMRYQSMVVSYANAILRDFQMAEDVAQEVAGIVVREWDRIPHNDELAFWLKETTRRKALEASRKRQKLPVMLPDDTLDIVGRQFADEQNHETERQRLDNMMLLLQDCVKRLRQSAQKILQARYCGNQSVTCEEIASMTGRSIQSVYAVLKRSREALVNCVDTEMIKLKDSQT
jgi:RNA polymerase sigma-70 factor (ECF subfamily)